MITNCINYNYSSYQAKPAFGNKNKEPEKLNFENIIDMKALENKPFGVDKRYFSERELQILNLSDVANDYSSITWRGTTSKPHTLYRGMASLTLVEKVIKDKGDEEDEIRSIFIEKLYKMKKGEKLCFTEGCCHPSATFATYDPLEAAVYCDLGNICKNYVDKRVFFEIDMPRNSHMVVPKHGYRSSALLPPNNIYELVEDPKIIKAKVIPQCGDSIQNIEFLHVKLRLKKEVIK